MPYADNSRTDCSNLLALRLSLQQGTGEAPLNDCSSETFTQSPPFSTFDCTGRTANECAAMYQQNLPHTYMSGGWNANQELWYLPPRRTTSPKATCVSTPRGKWFTRQGRCLAMYEYR